MPFQSPPGQDPERILLYGIAGTGKSKACHSIAWRLATSGSRNKMWVVDTDYSWRRLLQTEGDPGNIILKQCDIWADFGKAISDAMTKGQPGDWVVVDLIGVAWEMCQNAYIERAYSQDPIDFLVDARAKMKKSAGMGAALSGMGDWPFIKRMYRAVMNDLIAQAKMHVIGITTQEKIWESDAPDVLATYNVLGGKPGGEKHLDYGFHTVLQCGQNYQQKFWWLSTAKDRGRAIFNRTPITDFASSYLEAVAGWSDPTAGMVVAAPPAAAPMATPTAPPLATPAAASVAAPAPALNGNAGGGTETPAEKLARIKAARGLG